MSDMHTKQNKLIDNFETLNDQEKKSRLISLLELILDKVSLGKWMREYLINNSTVSSTFMNSLYGIILKVWLNVQWQSRKKQQSVQQALEKVSLLESKKSSEEADNLFISL